MRKHSTKLTAMILSIVMVLSLVVVPASAARPMGSGEVAETPASSESSGAAPLANRPAVSNDEPAELLDAAAKTEWVFGGDGHSTDTFAADSEGLIISDLKAVNYHNNYGALAKPTKDETDGVIPATIGIPVSGPSKVTVTVGYTWDISVGDVHDPERYGREAATSGNNGSQQAKVFNCFGPGAGYVLLTAYDTTSTYIYSIKVEALTDDTVAIPSKVEVWDVGTEELSATIFNNKLDATTVKSWYPTGVSENVGDIVTGDLSVINAKNKGALAGATTEGDTRVRIDLKDLGTSSTSNITKTQVAKGGDPYDANREKYHGSLQNNGGLFTVKLANSKAGDKLTYIVGEGNNDAMNATYTDPSGATQDVSKSGSGGVAYTFYVAQAGEAVFANTSAKMNIARIYRETPTKVTLSGSLVVGEGVPDTYKLVITDDASGAEYEATTTANTWTAEVNNYLSGSSFTLSVKDANGCIVGDGETMEIPAGVKTATQAVSVIKVDLVSVSGTITGLDAADLAKVSLSAVQPEGKIYVPEITLGENGAYSVQLEKDVEYTLVAKYVNDYALTTTTLNKGADATDADIAFAKKPTYAVTISPSPLTLADLADAEFTFTNLLEAGDEEDANGTPYNNKSTYHYEYTFTGPDNIELRDGTYNVAVNTKKGVQKITPNLVVDGAAATRTIKFDVEPQYVQEGKKTFTTNGSEEGLKGVTWTNMASADSHGVTDRYKTAGTDASFTLNLEKDATVVIESCKYTSAGKLSINGTELEKDVDDNGDDVVGSEGAGSTVYTIEAEAGELTIDIVGTYFYVHSLEVTYKNSAPVTVAADDYDLTAAAVTIDGATFTGLSYHNSHGYHGGANSKLTLALSDEATVTLITCCYGNGMNVTASSGTVTAEDTNEEDKTAGKTVTITGAEAGNLEITFGAEVYFHSFKVEYDGPAPAPGDDLIFPVGTDKTYKTINAALDAIAKADRPNGERAVVMIDPGNYQEMIWLKSPNVTFKNASANPSIALKNKGVDIDDNAVRITWYYGCGYDYYSMGANSKYDADQLEVNLENGYPSHPNSAGGGKTNESWWNSTTVIAARGFTAENIIFENSFNQYISTMEAADKVVPAAKDCPETKYKVPTRTTMQAGDTTVQQKNYVERACALAIADNVTGGVYFEHCAFVGHQDILFGGNNVKAGFYDCDLYGACDYIMGPMNAVFAKCDLVLNVGADNNANDVAYITAPQQAGGRGYLMWNCNVRSVVPGVENAGTELTDVQHAFGRAWGGAKAEAIFFETTVGVNKSGKSLIGPEGWNTGLGNSKICSEYHTHESATEYDHSKRIMGGVLTQPKTHDNVDIDPTTWMGDYNPFEGKDMDIVCPGGHTITALAIAGPEGSETAAEITLGDEAQTIQLTAATTPVDANEQEVTWTSDNAKVTVSTAGLVTIAADATAGTATITATSKDVSTVKATYVITLKAADGEENPPEVEKTPAEKLADAIAAAKDAAGDVSVSTDGNDVYTNKKWVDQDAMDAFEAAIAAAETVAKTEGVTDEALNNAIAALAAASETFEQAQNDGLKKRPSGSGPAFGTGTKPTESGTTTTETAKNPNGDTVTTVTDPNGDQTVTVTDENGEVLAEVTLPATNPGGKVKFVDVPEDHWAAKSIDSMAGLGMVKGVSDDTFDMYSAMTRGSVATMFYRLAGEKAIGENTYADVNEGDWYADGVAWATKAGVVTGYSADAFGPNDTITRQQLAVMATRFAKLLGIDVSKANDSVLGRFTDGGAVDAWAVEGMSWCISAGIFQGRGDGTVDPTAEITRAEAAVVFDRLVAMIQK